VVIQKQTGTPKNNERVGPFQGPDEVVQLREEVQQQKEQLNALSASIEHIGSLILKLRDDLLHERDEIHTSLYDLQSANTRGTQEATADLPYHQTLRRIREAVRTTLPRDCKVIVVSKGDDDLLKLYGRTGLHFPQNKEGEYAGYYPPDSASAIVQLEILRALGGDYLLFPETAFWWLKDPNYEGFKRHLEHRYRVVLHREDTCMIFALRQPALLSGLDDVIAEYQARFDKDPAIMDWHTGMGLKASFPQHNVFSPSSKEAVLPYLEESIDIVVSASSDSGKIAEARRIAAGALVRLDDALHVEWRTDALASDLPPVSIIIPAQDGNHAQANACLARVADTLPREFRGEVIVVSNGSVDDAPRMLQEWTERDPRVKMLPGSGQSSPAASCNQAAESATGEILIFLVPSTLVLPGWLPPLLRIFHAFPDAGVVGGKVLSRDGVIAAAGGRILRNGLRARLGAGEHAVDAPSYNYVRQVDYCSSALLATPRSVFQAVDGFDTSFGLLEYADVDYCYKAREHGCPVLYQPESSVVQIEERQHTREAQAKFLHKWHHAIGQRRPDSGVRSVNRLRSDGLSNLQRVVSR
jgi:GT2 family glycosyltransferase